MTAVPAVNPKLYFPSCPGGTVDVYLAGTTTRSNTWQDRGLTTLNTNPIVLDARGECVAWLDSTKRYKFVVKTSGGASVYTVDNVQGAASAADASAAAQDWATKTSATVDGSEFSSKEYAQGSQAATGGSAKNWAQQTGSDVTGASANDRSAKSWAQENLAGATLGGSAKDWAQSASSPDGTYKSAKSYAQDAENFAGGVGAVFYDTIAAGLAAVASGATFGVKAGGSDGLTRPTIYRDDAGSATMLYAVLPASEYDAQFPALSGVTPVWVRMDDKGNTSEEVYSDGSTGFAALKTPTINGFSVRSSLRPTNMGTFDGELVFLNNTGQSLAAGNGPALTNTQEYDNVGFPYWSVSPAAVVTLTAPNCAQQLAGGRYTEPPLFGALYYIKKLLEEENGLTYTGQKFQLVGCDNSHGSYSIVALNKGTALYDGAISQALSTKTIADASNWIPLAGGTFWTQGEADSAMSVSAYQALYSQLATDYNTDFKAQTGQTKDAPFISYQTTSTAGGTVPQAQLAASIANSLIRIACPLYQFDKFTDSLHIDAECTKWMGCYYGLVWKRVMVDGATWSPLRPLSVAAGGVGKKWVNVLFSVPVKPLAIDTTQVPAQSQYGFTIVDSVGTDIPITNISVVSPTTVKFEVGSNLPAGAKLRAAFAACTGKSPYVGGATNLRDSQGDSVPLYENHRLDNWCLMAEMAM